VNAQTKKLAITEVINDGDSLYDAWNSRVRKAFWLIGILAGGLLTYTTRHYLNGDGINYIEMGEALRNGVWSGLVNLTESPGYAFLLGLGQILLNTDRSNELALLKVVNFVSLLAAMASCDVFLGCVRQSWGESGQGTEKPLPFCLVSALCYSLFLFAAFSWVKLRLVAPEMMLLALVPATVSAILRIKKNPANYSNFVLLGAFSGLTYLFKSFFFPFSAVFFTLAILVTGSFRKALPRVMLAVVAMLLVSAPLIVPLSKSLGRFSFGEVGNLCYSANVSGEGRFEHAAAQLSSAPEVLFYGSNPFVDCTRPAGFDLCYWNLGMKPVFNVFAQLKVIPGHVLAILSDSPWLFLATGLWLVAHWKIGRLRVGSLLPPSPFFVFMAVAMAGIGLYCLVHVEIRYLASFLFLGFTALVVTPRYNPADPGVRYEKATELSSPDHALDSMAASQRVHPPLSPLPSGEGTLNTLSPGGRGKGEGEPCKANAPFRIFIPSILLVVLILGLVTNTVVDNTVRGLASGGKKPSFAEAYAEMVAIKNSLGENGVGKNSRVAMIGLPLWYWGRLAEVKIVAEAFDQERFLSSAVPERTRAVEAMKSAGVKAVVAQGSEFGKLAEEGWRHVTGTRDFYILFMN
jgi:hypothetical protein